jgi:hypothetical protein
MYFAANSGGVSQTPMCRVPKPSFWEAVFFFKEPRSGTFNMSTFSTPDTSLRTSLSHVDPNTDRDPSSISISIHLREEYALKSRGYMPLCGAALLLYTAQLIRQLLRYTQQTRDDLSRRWASSARAGCGQAAPLCDCHLWASVLLALASNYSLSGAVVVGPDESFGLV